MRRTKNLCGYNNSGDAGEGRDGGNRGLYGSATGYRIPGYRTRVPYPVQGHIIYDIYENHTLFFFGIYKTHTTLPVVLNGM